MGMAGEMDEVLLDCVTCRTVFRLAVRVIIDSILHTMNRLLTISQYERNRRTHFFHLLT